MKAFPTAVMVLAGFCQVPSGFAQAAPGGGTQTTLPEVQAATAALRDRLPEVAVLKLRRVLEAGKVGADQRSAVVLLLAEALVRAGRPAEVLPFLEDKGVAAVPEAKFWRAQALARLERWREAEALLASLAGVKDFRYAAEAAFSRAGLLAAMGDTARAGGILTPLCQSPGAGVAVRATLWLADLRLAENQPKAAAALLDQVAAKPGSMAERDYLKARIAMRSGDFPAADALFALLSGEHSAAPLRLQQAARLGRARSLQAQGKPTEALAVLRQLTSMTPQPPAGVLDVAFQDLEALNHPPTEEMETFLNTLASGSDPGLKIRARMALAAALESMADPHQAEAAWHTIPRDFPDHPLQALALLRETRFLIAQGRRKDALPLLDQLKKLSPTPAIASWTAWVAGQAEYDAAAWKAASAHFTEAASGSTDPALRAAASYNAAMAELQAGEGNPGRSLALLEDSPLEEYRMAGAEFHLERALRMASLGDAGAADGLQAFADSLPDHPRRFDALIALAEIALTGDPGRAAVAVAAAQEAAREPWQQERTALLDCYATEAAGQGKAGGVAISATAFTAKAAAFLVNYPQSAARTDLRMKVAQIHYRRENFSGARQMFEALAADDPLHPLAEPALFWAGRAALLTMEPTASKQAVVLWEKVFALNGPLKWQARLQEALLNQKEHQPAAALQLLDEILLPSATPLPEETTRWQALLARGEILASPDMKPEEQGRGLKAFDEVLAAPGLPSDWHRQTLVRKGVSLEALKRPDEALEAYYDVLADLPAGTDAAAGQPPEDYWFHRAGDKAIRLLTGPGKFEEAIEIAKKMAKAPGPRGRAAADLVDELALKYSIWIPRP